MKIHVLTPFYRVYLAPTLIHYLEPMGIEWYPIMTPSELYPFNKDWIHPVYMDSELPPNAKCCYKFNVFLEQNEIIDNDYYVFMCDDNMYEPGFFDVIRQQTAKIVIFSLYRGDTIPNDGAKERHLTTILRPKRLLDVRPGNIDYAQYIIKGELFKTHPFNAYQGCTDGIYIQKLCFEHPNDIIFLPDLYAWFNYFQPGRYTNKKRFPKDNWELPEYK